jgi:sulfatase maturation enzyme AslB (radical SAM superfamily)
MANVDTSPEAPSRRTKDAILAAEDVPPFAFVLVKLASRCNINCTYCYWFRDAEVYNKPAVLTIEAEDTGLVVHLRGFR